MEFRVACLLVPLAIWSCSVHSAREPTAEEKARRATVQRLFAEGCKRSGEFISRTVPGIEGILLMKLRPTDHSPYNQNAVDPYGYDFDWVSRGKPPPYISTFLIGKDENGFLQETRPIVKSGYKYVDATDSNDGKRYRYTGALKDVTHTSSILIGGDGKTKFVTRDFVVEREIARSSLRIIDLKTNEVIAERIGYMVDFAQGATPGGRQPWTFARKNKGWSCPELNSQSYGARRFVEKVLLIRDAQPINPPDAAR
jgi:hypothetical protein